MWPPRFLKVGTLNKKTLQTVGVLGRYTSTPVALADELGQPLGWVA